MVGADRLVAFGLKTAGSGLMSNWSEREWQTLQFAPLWVVSAMVGRDHLDEPEQKAFWRAVDDAPERGALSWQLLDAVSRNRNWMFDQFALDGRSIVSGLNQVADLLERVPGPDRSETKQAILRVGSSFARARGPFGQSIMRQDTMVLALVAQLLESMSETVADNPLNAASAV